MDFPNEQNLIPKKTETKMRILLLERSESGGKIRVFICMGIFPFVPSLFQIKHSIINFSSA